MKGEMKRLYILILVMSLAVFMLFLSMIIPIMTSDSDFSILNPAWNGCSELGAEYYEGGSLVPNYKLAGTGEEVTIAQKDITEYDLRPSGSVIVILRPVEDFTGDEIAYLRDYLSNGGTLLLADDFGTGNSLLEGLECNSRFSNKLFISLAFNKDPKFSVTIDIASPFDTNVSHILLNHPSTLTVGDNTTVYGNTPMGWLDDDKDYRMDEEEQRAVFPILAVEKYNRGKVILLSDPSVLINSMLDKADNRNFVQNLFEFAIPGQGKVVFDESHSGDTDTLTTAGIFLNDLPPLFTGVLLIGFLSIVIFISLDLSPEGVEVIVNKPYIVTAKGKVIRLIKRFTPSPKLARVNVVETVAKRHPEWDKRLLTRLLESSGPD
jgi:hypothetical protein